VSMLLPLGPDQVVLLEVFPVEVRVQLLLEVAVVLGNEASFIVGREDLVHLPPPAIVLEEVDQQVSIVAFPHEDLVELELVPLEVQLHLVGTIYHRVEPPQDHLLPMNHKILAFEEVLVEGNVLRDFDA